MPEVRPSGAAAMEPVAGTSADPSGGEGVTQGRLNRSHTDLDLNHLCGSQAMQLPGEPVRQSVRYADLQVTEYVGVLPIASRSG